MSAAKVAEPTPLFPLRTVLFPGGRLPLKIFEARYLDMVSRCLRDGSGFGVVCLNDGAEAGPGAAAARFASSGTMARIEQAGSPQAGILMLDCSGGERFRIEGQAWAQADGLWLAHTEALPADVAEAPAPAMLGSVTALARALQQLQAQGQEPIRKPYLLDDAGWVANRWCELLPLNTAAKQMLLELGDPLARLAIIDRFLRQHEVVN